MITRLTIEMEPEIKQDFKLACFLNGVDMRTAVIEYMHKYVQKTKGSEAWAKSVKK